MEESQVFVPAGWIRTVVNGRVVYLTPAPNSVKIYSKSDLVEYQKKGKFKDIDPNELVFVSKRKQRQKNFEVNRKDSIPELKKNYVVEFDKTIVQYHDVADNISCGDNLENIDMKY